MPRRTVKYTPSLLSDKELKESFVARQADLEMLMEIVRENVTIANQHVLIIGARGSGKTMLALRAVLALREDAALHALWYPIVFSEESYEVASAGEFWLEAVFHLAEQSADVKWKQTYAELREEQDDNRLRERALGQLMDFADSQGKRLLLIVENLHMLLSDLMDDAEAWKLRHTLMNEPRVMLLASAVSRFKGIDHPSRPMFEMFKLHELRAFTDEECARLWRQAGGAALDVEEIRPVSILTGGNPRLIRTLAAFCGSRPLGALPDALLSLIDEHTEYFKSHLDNLPPTERKVYLALAELWNDASAREVAEAARLNINKTSALLKRLEERGAVLIRRQEKRGNVYAVAERMHTIYYLTRRRGKPTARIKRFVTFMLCLYAPEQSVVRSGANTGGAGRGGSVAHAIQEMLALCMDLAASGKAGEALERLEGSCVREYLEPLAVALHSLLGTNVRTAWEIGAVAGDILARIKNYRRKG